jgi:hypothetical protein
MDAIPTYRHGPIIEEPSSDGDESGTHSSSQSAGAAVDCGQIDPRVEEIMVELNAIALPRDPNATGPRVTHPGEKSDRAALLSIAVNVSICYGREHEVMQYARELHGDGVSLQEIDEIIARDVNERIRPEIEMETKKEDADQWERIRMIKDPKTRSSIIPRNSLETSVMETELTEVIAAEAKERADLAEAELRGEKKKTVESHRSFFSKIAALFIAAAAAIAAFFCFIGWKLGLCSKPKSNGETK